jgi:molybdate transport system ATP-binding protein
LAVNLIPTGDADIAEMPFEWYITLENGLWWKKEKTIHTHTTAGLVPQALRIDPGAILLLRS